MRSRWRPTPARLAQVVFGLVLFGMGEGLLVASELGNSPWSVFAEGIEEQTPLKLGYVEEARLRRRLEAEPGGEPRDAVVFSLFRDQFPASPAASMQLEAYDAAGRKVR